MRDQIFGSPSELIQWFKLNAAKKKENPVIKEIPQSHSGSNPNRVSRFTTSAPPPPPPPPQSSSSSGSSFGRSRQAPPPPPPPPPPRSSYMKKPSRFSNA